MPLNLDVSTVAILAAITLLEGVRRVPTAALVLRRSVVSDWEPCRVQADGRPRLLSWWSPLGMTIVLVPPSDDAEHGPAEVRSRIEAARAWYPAIAIAGGGVLAALVFGLPVAIGLYGTGGFLIGLGLVVVLSFLTSTLAFLAARRLGLSRSMALRWVAPFLWPFAAPRASEALVEEAARGLPPALVAQQLLPGDAFYHWLRPFAYDMFHGTLRSDGKLMEGLDAAVLSLALHARDAIEAGASLFCARCGGSFVSGTTCPDCEVPLESV